MKSEQEAAVRAGVVAPSLNRRKQTHTEVSKLLKPEP